eukprot:scaffold3437_cov113-Cylindrotheca_fusiformis.AAC.10
MQIPDRVKHCAIITTLVAIAAAVAWHFAGRPDFHEIRDDLAGSWSDLWDEGPQLSDNTTYYWPTGGRGVLTLEIVSLLDPGWQGEFEAAVRAWDNGDPDVVTLTTSRRSANDPCTMSQGIMKVCNQDYGSTGWLGINEIVIGGTDGKTIRSSLAKMNDHYLGSAKGAERAYTMCHELGHGFGLPHTDESFTNRDLGNCMDYTNTPENNLLPGRVNFLRLQEMYGSPNAMPRNADAGTSNVFENEREEDDDRRFLRVRDTDSAVMDEKSDLSPELLAEYERAMEELSEHLKTQSAIDYDSPSGWRMLHEHPLGGEFARRLDSEHTLKVQMMYAEPMVDDNVSIAVQSSYSIACLSVNRGRTKGGLVGDSPVHDSGDCIMCYVTQASL